MGAWGTAIFSDDLALDVRTTYEDLLLYDRTPEEAERITIAEYDMEALKPNRRRGLRWRRQNGAADGNYRSM